MARPAPGGARVIPAPFRRLLAALLLLLVSAANAADTRPNILLVVADDLGFTDLGSFGGEIATPNLDSLAMEGVRFSNFHVMPACSPTRAVLYTGVDPHLAGVGSMYEELSPNQKGQPGFEGYLNDRVVSVATLLRDNGYRTYLTGKWHLANTPEQGPGSQGFQRSFALLSGGASHFDDMRPSYSPDPKAKAAYAEDDTLLEALPDGFVYSSQFYVDRLIQYLGEEDTQGRPFFAVLAYTAPHWPLQAPDAAIAKYRGQYDAGYDALYRQRRQRVAELGLLPAAPEPMRPPKAVAWENLGDQDKRVQARAMEVYAAMVDQMDFHTGRLVDYLRKTGQLDNTLVLFMSDNGPEGHDLDETWPADKFPAIRKVIDERHDFSFANMGRPGSYLLYGSGWARAGSAGLRMYKGFPSEGGTRVSAFARFPGQVEAGQVLGASLSVRDIAPTILDFADVAQPGEEYRGRRIHPMQGRSLRGLLGDTKQVSPPLPEGVELFGKYALRAGDWKLLVMPPPYASGKAELYKVSEDPGETVDLAGREPGRLKSMLALWQEYAGANGVILPDWVSGY